MTQRPCIVVAYDGSAAAMTALDVAVERAARIRGRLIVVHAGADPRHRLDGLLLEGHDALADLDWEPVLVDGDAASVIVREAERRGAVEIVMGTRGRGRAASLLGSVAQDVLRHSPCPVTVVRERFAAA